MYMANSLVNPLVLCYSWPTFRLAFRLLLFCCPWNWPQLTMGSLGDLPPPYGGKEGRDNQNANVDGENTGEALDGSMNQVEIGHEEVIGILGDKMKPIISSMLLEKINNKSKTGQV